jgi:serine O-acetyltransferase
MIKSKADYQYYRAADRIALGISIEKTFLQQLKSILFPHHIWAFQKTLRKLEYYRNCKKDLLSKLYMIYLIRRYRQQSLKLGFTIPENVFGPGLSIAHYGSIVINDRAKVGANCRLHVGVNIGAASGSSKAPVLGDHCYIGPGAKIYGDIHLADGIAIGANAVVNKSFDEPNICIAGVPAKKVSNLQTHHQHYPVTSYLDHQPLHDEAYPTGTAMPAL